MPASAIMTCSNHDLTLLDTNRRWVSPPGQRVPLETLNEKLQTALSEIRPRIEKFLRNPDPPTWTPPATVIDPDHRKFLSDLNLPTYRNGNPSLLFHNLANAYEFKVNRIFGDGKDR